MKTQSCIPEHYNPGRICVQTILGHIRMHADDKLFDLPQGKILVLDRAAVHDVEALEDSAFLLTVAYPQTHRQSNPPLILLRALHDRVHGEEPSQKLERSVSHQKRTRKNDEMRSEDEQLNGHRTMR